MQKAIATIAPVDSVERFEGLGVHVLREFGRFISKTEVQAGDTVIEARRFVIATGSSPFVPPIPGIDKVKHYTNEDIFDLRERPDHLLIIGGGPIGMEMAQAHRRLGSKVTVIEGEVGDGQGRPRTGRHRAGKAARRGGRDSRRATGCEGLGQGRGGDSQSRRRHEIQRLAPADCGGPQGEYRPAGPGQGRGRSRPRGQGGCGAAHLEPAGLCRGRRCRRPAIHPCRGLPRGRHRPLDAVRPAVEAAHRSYPLGHLHRPRTGTGRADARHRRATPTATSWKSCAFPMPRTTAPSPKARQPA